MSRYQIATRMYSGDWEPCSMIDDDPECFDTLRAAREELQDHLLSTIDAVNQGDMSEAYSPSAFAVKDLISGLVMPVSWDRSMKTLQIEVSFKDVLTRVIVDRNETQLLDDRSPSNYLAELASAVCEFGVEGRHDDIVVLLPSVNDPTSDMHAIAPAGWERADALTFANEAIGTGQSVTTDRGSAERLDVRDAIGDVLRDAGFTLIGDAQGNMVRAMEWDRDTEFEIEEPTAPRH